MKFLIIAQRFHTNLYYRAKALQDAQHELRVNVLYKGKSEFYENINIQQIPLSFFSKCLIKIVSFFNKTNLKSNLELRLQSPGRELKRIIKSYKPDVILLKAYQNALAIKVLRIAKREDIKVLMLTQTNFTHIKGSKFLFKLNIKLFKYLKVHAYITPVKSNYEAFKKFGIKNVFYLPFVYPLKEFSTKEFSDEINIISVGKFQNRKNQLLLLNAFKVITENKPKLRLNIIGEIADEKYYEIIRNFIQQNSLSNNVSLQAHLNYLQIEKEYAKYDLFILPAHTEPASYSVVEALANGLPVICSDENGTKCYIEEGRNGFVFKAKELNSLVQKIKQSISDLKKFREMQKEALFSAKKNHDPKQFSEKLIKIINSEI